MRCVYFFALDYLSASSKVRHLYSQKSIHKKSTHFLFADISKTKANWHQCYHIKTRRTRKPKLIVQLEFHQAD